VGRSAPPKRGKRKQGGGRKLGPIGPSLAIPPAEKEREKKGGVQKSRHEERKGRGRKKPSMAAWGRKETAYVNSKKPRKEKKKRDQNLKLGPGEEKSGQRRRPHNSNKGKENLTSKKGRSDKVSRKKEKKKQVFDPPLCKGKRLVAYQEEKKKKKKGRENNR